ncbi:MAG TPA: SpoIIE family protein phosphatase [Acidimicrobiia bacterium]|nr:SpoIIE family protein phosphatase [Acidimicrobiia bacterium]
MTGVESVNESLLAATPISDRSVLDALRRAVVVTRTDGEIVTWNRAAEDLYGWTEAEVVGRDVFELMIPVSELDRAEDVRARAVAGMDFAGDFTVTRRDGNSRFVHTFVRGVVAPDGTVEGIVAVSEDVTEQRLLDRRAQDLTERLALALDAGGFGTWRWDLEREVVEWDAPLERLFGLLPGTFDGTYDSYLALLHPDDRAATATTVEEAVRTRQPYVVDHRVVWPDGSVHWLQGKGRVTVDAAGNVTGTIGCTADVTEPMRRALAHERDHDLALAAAEIERLGRERLQFLADINDALNRADTELEVLTNVTRAAVPWLGEWCAIVVLPDDGEGRPMIEVAHADPAMEPFAREMQTTFPFDIDASTGVGAVVRTGRTEFLPEVDESTLHHAPITNEQREIARRLALRSAITVPLIKRGRVLGALQFVNSTWGRVYTEADRALAEVAAGRIASTLMNRRLAEHQRLIATTLQQSLLPESLPEIEGLELAVGYWAAGTGTQVGGDFYDVFEIDDGWAVVIGDVCGTGPHAASLTGLVRHTIRTLAWHGLAHEEVLQYVNRAILRSGRSTFCTALYATLRHGTKGFTFEMAAGGHPLPIRCRADGRTSTIGMPGTLLGAYADPKATTVTSTLEAGDTLVLYTDGITDVRPPHDLSTEALRTIVARVARDGASAANVVTRLGEAVSDILPIGERNDDIAMLVLRVP